MDTTKDTGGQGNGVDHNAKPVEATLPTTKKPKYEAFKNVRAAEMMLTKLFNFQGYGDFKKAYNVQRFCKKVFSALKEYPKIVEPYLKEKMAIQADKEMSNEQKEEASKVIISKLESEVWSKDLDITPWNLKVDDVKPVLNQLSPAELESLDYLLSDELMH